VSNNKRHLSLLLLLFVLIGLITFGTVGTEKAYACSCLPYVNYTTALQDSSHVLDATVVNKKQLKDGNVEVVLSVAAKWKGEAELSMTVITASDSAACGYEFEIGKRYAVFTNEHEGKLHVSLCSATTPIADDSPIFEELGSPEELSFTRDDDGITTTAKVDGGESGNEPYHPDQIKESVTSDELEQKLAQQKSSLIILFVIVGGLLIVGAGALLLIRNRR